MTNKGQAVTNPRISAGATTVKKPTSPLGVWFRANFHKNWRAESAVCLTSSNHINADDLRRRLLVVSSLAAVRRIEWLDGTRRSTFSCFEFYDLRR